MTFTNRWANNNGVKIHYLDNTAENSLTPLLYIPGALNSAEQSMDMLKAFMPRRIIFMSLRGRGKSDAPVMGYSFEDHVSDIQTVVSQSHVQHYCLFAYSMGVPFAIQHAAYHNRVKGIIICDYPAKYPRIPESWVERVLSRGFIPKEREHVVEGIQKDSKAIELYETLSNIHVPVLIIKGETEESLLSSHEVEKYKQKLPVVTVVEMKDSGHELWEPNKDSFLQVINHFLERLDV